MVRFSVQGNIGELSIRSLGNASPEIATVSHSIGELSVGLDGEGSNDSMVTVRSSIGECRVKLVLNQVDHRPQRVSQSRIGIVGNRLVQFWTRGIHPASSQIRRGFMYHG